jgi:hypothetical protein
MAPITMITPSKLLRSGPGTGVVGPRSKGASIQSLIVAGTVRALDAGRAAAAQPRQPFQLRQALRR